MRPARAPFAINSSDDSVGRATYPHDFFEFCALFSSVQVIEARMFCAQRLYQKVLCIRLRGQARLSVLMLHQFTPPVRFDKSSAFVPCATCLRCSNSVICLVSKQQVPIVCASYAHRALPAPDAARKYQNPRCDHDASTLRM
jgi:hypothetical protein